MSESNELEKAVVLIIEDDEFLRGVISQKLEKEGFSVKNAIDASEALKLLKEGKPRIILLDLILPGMGGMELLSVFKKDQSTANIPVIILSNLGQKEDKEKALEAGAADYMIKADHTPDEIVERIRKVLGQSYL